ncbi:MAG: hypothetical protein KM310_00390, partial [Clostridiales bacterium]|nr:hypothetical protein [Clostridiales bacterium]
DSGSFLVTAPLTISSLSAPSTVMAGKLFDVTATLDSGSTDATYTLQVLDSAKNPVSSSSGLVQPAQYQGSFKGKTSLKRAFVFGKDAAGQTFYFRLEAQAGTQKVSKEVGPIAVVAPPSGSSESETGKILIIKPSIRITVDETAELIVAWQNLTGVTLTVEGPDSLPIGGALPDNKGPYTGDHRFTLSSSLWRQGAPLPKKYKFIVEGRDRTGQQYREEATLLVDQQVTRLSE